MDAKPDSKADGKIKPKDDTRSAKGASGIETKKWVRRMSIFAAFAVLFFWLAQIVDSHRLFLPALFLELLGIFCSACALWITLRNYASTRDKACRFVTGYVLVGTLVSIGLFEWEKTQKVPNTHFRLAFVTTETSGRRHAILDLTNECLKANIHGGIFGPTIGLLNVPVDKGKLLLDNFSVSLIFDIFNETPTDGSFLEVMFNWSSSVIKVPITSGWVGIVPSQGVSDAMGYEPESPITVLHGDGKTLPKIEFDGINSNLANGTLGSALFAIRQSNAEDTGYAFMIHFVSDTNMSAYMTEFASPIGTNIGAIMVPEPHRPNPN